MEICVSKLYGPPKRRSIPAIRKLPRGCKVKPAEAITQRLIEVNHSVFPSEISCSDKREEYSENVALGKICSGSNASAEKVPVENDTIKGTKDEVKDSAQLDQHLLGVTKVELCTSKLYGPPKKRKKPAVRPFPPGCGPLAVVIGNQPSQTPGQKSSEIESASLSKANSCKKSLVKHMHSTGEDEQTNKSHIEDLNSFPGKAMGQRTTGESSGKASFELADWKSQFQISSGKARSGIDSRIPLRVGAAKKDIPEPCSGRSLPAEQGKGVKIQNQNCTDELVEDRRETTPVCKDENVNPSSDRDRTVILALMASPNCPWRRGKGSVRAVQQSSSTLVKIKRKKE